MNLAWSISLIALGTAASAAIGIALAASPYGAVAGVPPAVVGVWQAWQGYRREQAMQRKIAELRAHTPITAIERHRAAEELLRLQTSIRIASGDRNF